MPESLIASGQQPAVAAVSGVSNGKSTTITLNAALVPNPLAHQWLVIGSAAAPPTTVGDLDGGHAVVYNQLVNASATLNSRQTGGTWSMSGTVSLPAGLGAFGGVIGHTAYAALVTKATAPVDADPLDVVAPLGVVAA